MQILHSLSKSRTTEDIHLNLLLGALGKNLKFSCCDPLLFHVFWLNHSPCRLRIKLSLNFAFVWKLSTTAEVFQLTLFTCVGGQNVNLPRETCNYHVFRFNYFPFLVLLLYYQALRIVKRAVPLTAVVKLYFKVPIIVCPMK